MDGVKSRWFLAGNHKVVMIAASGTKARHTAMQTADCTCLIGRFGIDRSPQNLYCLA